jgi:thiopurine S-methyltransferase
MELGLQPEISAAGEMERWSANNLDIFVGDIFALSRTLLGPVDGIYDRAALVAFPEDMRTRYTAHLIEMTHRAPQLLICFDYDQRAMEGPPFSVSSEEVQRHYAAKYDVRLIACTDVSGGLKGKVAAKENLWLLRAGA